MTSYVVESRRPGDSWASRARTCDITHADAFCAALLLASPRHAEVRVVIAVEPPREVSGDRD
jgi:hypothetical protein